MVLDERFRRSRNSPRKAVPPIIGEFLLSREAMDCTGRTIEDYEGRLLYFHRFIDGGELISVTKHQVSSYLLDFRNKGRAPATIKTHYRALKAFYNWMVVEEIITISPLAKIKPPRTEKKLATFLSEEQFELLAAACAVRKYNGARNRAIIQLLWDTGVRSSEVISIRFADLDSKRERIFIYGKGRKERYVEYTMESRQAVAAYVRLRNERFGEAQSPKVFLTEEGSPLQEGGLYSALKRLYERAGFRVKDACHIFRRTRAIRMLATMDPWQVMELMGWEDIETMDRYVRARKSEQILDNLSLKRREEREYTRYNQGRRRRD